MKKRRSGTPGPTDAFFRLGEAEEKLNDKTAAKQWYAKYLENGTERKRSP